MNPQQARQAAAETFPQPFDKGRFLEFSRNMLNKFDESNAKGAKRVCACFCVCKDVLLGQDWIAMKKWRTDTV
jgi:hypothetical protein